MSRQEQDPVKRTVDEGLEDVVLGTLLKFPECYRADKITEGHFYQIGHKRAIRIMREKGANLVEVSPIYGPEKTLEMMESTFSPAFLDDNLQRLADLSRLREGMLACVELIEGIDPGDIDESKRIMAHAAGRIARAGGSGSASTVYRMSEARAVLETFQRNQHVIRTGLHRNLGIRRKQLIYIGARPGGGKTAALGQVSVTVGSEQEGSVLLFSMEMDAGELMHRILCAHIGRWIDPMGADYLEIVDIHAEWLAARRIIIDDQASLTMAEIENRTAAIMAEERVSMVGVDYASLIQAGKGEKRNEAMADISRRLKILAKTGNVPVVCLSQLKREDGKQPTLESLAESDGLGRDADQVWVLWYDQKEQEEAEVAQIVLSRLKCRGGSVGRLSLVFDKPAMKFEEGSQGL